MLRLNPKCFVCGHTIRFYSDFLCATCAEDEVVEPVVGDAALDDGYEEE